MSSVFQEFLPRYESSLAEMADGLPWLQSQGQRFELIVESWMRHRTRFREAPAILDVGAYPGTLLKVLRQFCGETGRLAGIGLMGSEEFERDLARYDIDFRRANLDPLIPCRDPEAQKLPQTIPYPDGTFQFTVCTEMLEHVLDSMHLLRELRRVTAPGGLVLITTPNQAKLSHRLRLLLLGQSIYYPLKESIMYHFSDWRPHLREYTMAELSTMARDAGLTPIQSDFIDIMGDDIRLHTGRASLKLRAVKAALQVAMAWPSLRPGLLMMSEVR